MQLLKNFFFQRHINLSSQTSSFLSQASVTILNGNECTFIFENCQLFHVRKVIILFPMMKRRGSTFFIGEDFFKISVDQIAYRTSSSKPIQRPPIFSSLSQLWRLTFLLYSTVLYALLLKGNSNWEKNGSLALLCACSIEVSVWKTQWHLYMCVNCKWLIALPW